MTRGPQSSARCTGKPSAAFTTTMLWRLCEVELAPPAPNQSVTPTHVDCHGEKVGRTSPAPHFI